MMSLYYVYIVRFIIFHLIILYIFVRLSNNMCKFVDVSQRGKKVIKLILSLTENWHQYQSALSFVPLLQITETLDRHQELMTWFQGNICVKFIANK